MTPLKNYSLNLNNDYPKNNFIQSFSFSHWFFSWTFSLRFLLLHFNCSSPNLISCSDLLIQNLLLRITHHFFHFLLFFFFVYRKHFCFSSSTSARFSCKFHLFFLKLHIAFFHFRFENSLKILNSLRESFQSFSILCFIEFFLY